MRKSNLLDLRWPTFVNFINFAACSLALLWVATGGARAARPPGPSDQPEAYFNGSAYIRLVQTLSLHSFAGLSFRSCVGGELFSQRYEGHTVQVSALPDAVLAAFVTPAGGRREFAARLRALDNVWHFVALRYDAAGAGGPRLLLTVDRDQTVTVANATYNAELLSARALEAPAAVLLVGNMFSGCMREGPGLAFRYEQQQAVEFGPCPLTTTRCKDRKDVLTNPPIDHCFHEPCMGHGTCISRRADYECHCTARYSGKNCEIDVGPPCQSAPCTNGARCEESKLGDYICQCTPDYYGPQCQFEVSVNPLCASKPCRHNGSCQVPPNSDHYICTCQPGYTGANCDTDVDECEGAGVGACAHGGRCVDSTNNYTCDCTGTGYTGPRCEVNVNECLEGSASTCNGRGVCFDTYGSYVCLCDDGYAGDRCQYQSPCASVTCANGGTCVVTAAGPTCRCARGWAGPTCVRRTTCVDAACPSRSRCVEVGAGGVTVAGVVASQGKYAQCVCEQGYYGAPGPSPNCTSLAAVCQTAPCLNGATCDVNLQLNTFNCSCLPGYVGPYCEHKVSKAMLDGGKPTPSGSDAPLRCADNPCLHALSCNDYSNGYYYCECEMGWTGKNCEVSAVPCALPDYCKNGGQCSMMGGSVRCHCADGFTGNYCEYPITPATPPPAPQEPCAARPCQNGGMCRMRRGVPDEGAGAPAGDFTCDCRPGFEGALCEQKKPDCRTMPCRTGQECVELVNGQYKCRCPEGKMGLNCETPVTGPCASSPCNNGTCQESGPDNFTCTCDDGFTGRFCEEDIDECITMPNICNEGICVNGKPGGFQCYCTPGYTGEYCEIDFDECLSHPCKNNGTCENKVNNYECKCMPGFSNKDCSVNIDECSWKPCAEGATCIDGVADYTCVCPEGLTGKQCQVDIDDCQSQPCLNGGRCHDARNGYACDCDGTGFAGPECGLNVDECASQPCRNDASCVDLVNDYSCRCHPGYTGKNCEQDIQECDSQPCQYSGVCLERSNASLYVPPPGTPATQPVLVGSEPGMLLPAIFYNTFSYSNASGFECVCVAGVTGALCSVNVNECESSPCGARGTCVDGVGYYQCDCADGFEGTHCETEIDECERYQPCAHGRCRDRRADYKCECDEGWGGRNCSVALAGCEGAPCRHAGVCLPYLEGETVHRFRCTCAPGYHGTTCEKITTMSLGGNSYILVNKSREEGYDIQFRFKTTLSNGLLAIGKGFTYYILELAHGRLNLHSSLLNKWEGVYIGSNLNDSRWQKVFVAINSTHVVLAANEEQTIYPINLNEGSNSSHTAFPTTFVGGTVPSLAGLTHGPSYFVGCFQDVTINGEWVLPENHPQPDVVPLPPASPSTASWELNGVRATCPRTPQCAPNPCFSGGTCEDLWTAFRCTCQRPFLGHTCQYNLTAATFGYEGARSPSVVTVEVNEAARKAVRSVLDISMFIRTRQSTGLIFYLGSRPKLGSFDETSVAASLEGGELLVHLRFNQTPEDYTVGGTRLDNAYLHLIQVVRNSTLVQVKLNGTEYFRKSISAAKQLDAQVLYLGGKPPPPIPPPVTMIPTTVAAETGSRGVRSPQAPAPSADIPAPPATKDFFKGIIQDVQVSNGPHTMVVEFFPLNVPDLELPAPFGLVSFDEAAVFQGVVSDDSCRSAPCLHNGTCRVTWNDFMCVCPRGYKGKSCDEMEFCQLQDCPVNSVCRNLDGGYECLAKATFDGLNTTLSYKLDTGARPVSSNELTPHLTLPKLDSLQLTYRSKSGGTLLQAVHPTSGSSFSLAVFRDQVAAEWKLGGVESQPSIRRFKKDTPDYDWTTIVLTVADGVIKGGFYDWQKDDSPAFTADIDSLAWADLMAQGTIYLGGVRTFQDLSTAVIDINGFTSNATDNGDFGASQFVAKNMYLTDSTATLSSFTNRNGAQLDVATEPDVWDMTNGERLNVDSSLGENFKGCIGEVRIGGLLLPFFTPDELYIGPALALISSSAHFTLQRSRRGDPYEKLGCVLCFERDCRNGGHCADLAADYACRCPPGYAEDDCSVDVDECIGADCRNGATCVDGVANYTCQCSSGWEGWLCDTNIDECASGPCAHGGTCVDRLGTFLCMCGPEWAGATCGLPRRLTCDHAPCARGATCADAVTDPKTGNNFTCICAPGFDGVLCDTPYCELRPCKHSGRCMVDQNPPVCVCAPGYTGARCETEVDECVLAGPAACQHGGRCIDQLATYSCDCSQTGYTGGRCQLDVDECAEAAVDCGTGVCVNLPGSYVCNCTEGYCGVECALPDPCHSTAAGEDAPANASGPCVNGGSCVQRCGAYVDYECVCVDGWGGKNCTEQVVVSATGSESSNTNAVIIGVAAALAALALAAGALLALAANARSKRATRGTYSPSSQEYCNPRLEMIDNALKPPPEERLI